MNFQKIECPQCGSYDVDRSNDGKYWFCKSCRVKYVIAKDDEGNPYYHMPVEKEEIAFGQMAVKSDAIEVKKIKIREIKLSQTIESDVQKDSVNLELSERVSVIEDWLHQGFWDDVQNEINALLLENKDCAEAHWFGMMCEKKVSNDQALVSSFSNISPLELDKIDKIISESSPKFARRIIDLFFRSAYLNDSMCKKILKVIIPYAKNEALYKFEEYSNKISIAFDTVIRNHFTDSFEFLITFALNANEVDRYILYLEQFADSPQTSPEEKQKYYAKIICVDPGNKKIHRKLISADLQADANYEKCLLDLLQLLKYSENPDTETIGVIKSVISNNSTTSNIAKFMWKALGCYQLSLEKLKPEIKEYIKILLLSELWSEAKQFALFALSLDNTDADIYMFLCLAKLQAREESEVAFKQDNLMEYPEFKKAHALYNKSKNSKRVQELMSLAKRQKNTKKAKKITRWVAISIASVSVIIVLGIVIAIISGKNAKIKEQKMSDAYSEALELLSNEDWSGAFKAFAELGDYKESKQYLKEAKDKIDQENKIKAEKQAKYDNAIKLYEAGYFENALEAFQKIAEFDDSNVYILKCIDAINEMDYSEANSLFSNKKYEDALALFKKLDNYKDSKEKVKQCTEAINEKKYAEASALFASKKYEEALTAFGLLGNYKDSASKVISCKEKITEQNYNSALTLFEEKKYEEAIEAFEKLNGYKDSKEIINQCKEALKEIKYQNAISLFNQSRYKDSIVLFTELDSYKESQSYIRTATLRSAQVGDVITFGTYEQDNNTTNGKENIEWIVLDKKDGKLFILSKQVIEWMKYSDYAVWQMTSWEKSSIRQWLNDTFLNSAFSESEKGQIVLSDVALDEVDYGMMGAPGNDTQDHVFLLGQEEYSKYKSLISASVFSDYIYATVSDPVFGTPVCRWWLRYRHQQHDRCILTVDSQGRTGNEVANDPEGVRPAMWITIP